jgi:hypothetical protein
MGAGTGIHPVAATGARPALAPMCVASDRPSVTGQLRCLVKGEPDDQQSAFGGDPRRRVHCGAMALGGALERAPDDRSCRHGPGAVDEAGPACEVAKRAVDAPSREDARSGTRGVGGASRGVVLPSQHAAHRDVLASSARWPSSTTTVVTGSRPLGTPGRRRYRPRGVTESGLSEAPDRRKRRASRPPRRDPPGRRAPPPGHGRAGRAWRGCA